MRCRNTIRWYCSRIAMALLCSFIYAQFAQAVDIHVGKMDANRILFLGNSLTYVAQDLSQTPPWTGNWGMAASAEDKDYAHLVTSHIAAANGGTRPAMQAVNIVAYGGWEQNFGPAYDVHTQLKPLLDWKADILVVELGDNVAGSLNSEARKTLFADSLNEVLRAFKDSSQPDIFVVSTWWGTVWPSAGVDGILLKACADVGGVFVDISDVFPNPVNQGGWGGHPSDAGMAAIADRVWNAMVVRSVPEPSAYGLLASGVMGAIVFSYILRVRT